MDWKNFDRGVFLVNVLGIIYNPETKKILIGKRNDDPFLKELSWGFPGGRPAYLEDLEYYLKFEIKKKTNLDAEIKELIFAKTYPENREFLSIYYRCDIVGGEEKAGEFFVEIKWVAVDELQNYFTTSLHPTLLKYLKNL